MSEKPQSRTRNVNYSLFRDSSLESIDSNYWDTELEIGQNIVNLINNSVILPQRNLQVPIIASYFIHRTEAACDRDLD